MLNCLMKRDGINRMLTPCQWNYEILIGSASTNEKPRFYFYKLLN